MFQLRILTKKTNAQNVTKRLRSLGLITNSLDDYYICRDCGDKFPEPTQDYFCVKCSNRFPLEKAKWMSSPGIQDSLIYDLTTLSDDI